jgi:UDP-glucose 4-epimerase
LKILITGTSGFIGSRVLSTAISTWGKDAIIAFSTQSESQCHSIKYSAEQPNFGLSEPDLVALESVTVLILVGGYIPKRRGDENLISACNRNIFYMEKLLNLPFKSLNKIIYISTVDVYSFPGVISESIPAEPGSLYGWSKLYCEQLVASFSKSNRMLHHILRIGHVYGPGEEKYAKVLPQAMQNIVHNRPIELWGDGSDLRSFIYIDDVVTAIIAAVSLKDDVGIINVAGGRPISIKQLMDEVISISSKSVQIETREFTGAKRDCVFDTTKLTQYLLPQETDLITGLRTEYHYFETLK